MAEIGNLSMGIRLIPDNDTMKAILALLDLWQDDNPDMMVAMVPGKDRYVYEIIDRSGKKQEAVKPIIHMEDAWMDAFCGNCQGHLYHGLPLMDTEEYPDKPDYCSYCGKKVKWE